MTIIGIVKRMVIDEYNRPCRQDVDNEFVLFIAFANVFVAIESLQSLLVVSVAEPCANFVPGMTFLDMVIRQSK